MAIIFPEFFFCALENVIRKYICVCVCVCVCVYMF